MSFSFVPGDKVQVPEIKYKDHIELLSSDSAVIVIDMQNDFVRDEGTLSVPSAFETVPRIASLISRARKAKARIVYTQDTQVLGDPEFKIWPKHCLIGTWGWEIIEELKPKPEDLVCIKNRYDGFYGTWLEHFLCSIWNIKHMVIVGTMSHICVLHTAASAGLRHFHVVIPADGISSLTEFDQALTLKQVSSLYAGDVVKNSQKILFV